MSDILAWVSEENTSTTFISYQSSGSKRVVILNLFGGIIKFYLCHIICKALYTTKSTFSPRNNFIHVSKYLKARNHCVITG